MMIKYRFARDRGVIRTERATSYHSFSFGQYFDADYAGFGPIRALREDHLEPGASLPNLFQQDMDILTIALKGTITLEDDQNEKVILTPYDAHLMRSGTGRTLSFSNVDHENTSHLLQLWLRPRKTGIEPIAELTADRLNPGPAQVQPGVNQDGQTNLILLDDDVTLTLAKCAEGSFAMLNPKAGRGYWVQILEGKKLIGTNKELKAGDGLAVYDGEAAIMTAQTDSTILIVDLPLEK